MTNKQASNQECYSFETTDITKECQKIIRSPSIDDFIEMSKHTKPSNLVRSFIIIDVGQS
jgi:hypothetical protein